MVTAVVVAVMFPEQSFASHPNPTPTPTVIDLTVNVTVGSADSGGQGNALSGKIDVSAGVLKGEGSPLTQGINIGDSVPNGAGATIEDTVGTDATPAAIASGLTPEITPTSRSKDTRSKSGKKPSDDASDSSVVGSDSKSRTESRERSSRDPFARGTGQMIEPDSNGWFRIAVPVVIVGLLVTVAAVVFRRRR